MTVQDISAFESRGAPLRGSAIEPAYMSGFGNSFETEALPGALPLGMNSPQKVNYGLYAEQLSGSPFTAPQATNQRSWLYRVRPTVKHSGRYRRVDKGLIRTAPAARDESGLAIGQLRWDPIPIPGEALTFVTGLRTMTTAGDSDTQVGMAAHVALVTRSMENDYFFDADGELLVVAQEGALRFRTEFGVIDIAPGQIAVIPRGVIFKVELIGGPARAYVCENYGGAFTLPDRGPIGANCLANPRDFQTPVAAYEDREEPSTLYREMGRRAVRDRDRPVAPRRRRLARQLRALPLRSAPLRAGRRDPVRPPGPVDLHGADRPVRDARHREHRLRHLPGALGRRRGHVPAALVPPQPDVGVHGARLRRLRREARGLRARRHLAAQPDAAARAGRDGLSSTPRPSR